MSSIYLSFEFHVLSNEVIHVFKITILHRFAQRPARTQVLDVPFHVFTLITLFTYIFFDFGVEMTCDNIP